VKENISRSKTRQQKFNRQKQYAEINKRVKRSIRKGKRNWINEQAELAEEAKMRGDIKGLYNITKMRGDIKGLYNITKMRGDIKGLYNIKKMRGILRGSIISQK
jgi:hypothetical protein